MFKVYDQNDFAVAPARSGKPAVRILTAANVSASWRALSSSLSLDKRRASAALTPNFSQLTQRRTCTRSWSARVHLLRAGGCPADVTRRIAKRMGRSVETIRYTLKQFDTDHPDLAIFPHSTGPLSEEAKKKIYQQYRRGAPVDALAKPLLPRTKTSIGHRVINEMRGAPDCGIAAGFHPESRFCQAERRQGDFGADAGKRLADQENAAPQRFAAVSGQLVRGSVADARTRTYRSTCSATSTFLKYRASKTARAVGSGTRQKQRHGRNRAALLTKRSASKIRSCVPTCVFGGVHRQAACGSRR